MLQQVLNHQYRMHPDIAAFPAAEFYANALLNGEAVKAGTARAWHDHPVRPCMLFQTAMYLEPAVCGGQM